ncbi:hypothetical protein Syun_015931 [Stephania yunnanensis]|uniref:Arginine biosynthesis bifunctional protein ArgJ, chloroplastic n=1 Tax=Stephania yunnanensis TaxID=152371 RepID=A0AAP0P200_9MAGN
MAFALHQVVPISAPQVKRMNRWSSSRSSRLDSRVFAVSASSSTDQSLFSMPTAPILLPEGPWEQIPGGVTAAKGFKAAGMYAGLRAKGNKPDLALVTCDVDATAAGVFTTNLVAAAPVVYSKHVLQSSTAARAVLINAGQANAATGDGGYQDVIECSNAVAKLLQLNTDKVLIESTGVIGQRIKKDALLASLPKLVNSLSPTIERYFAFNIPPICADSAAIAITTTDLVSKSVAIESEVKGTRVRVGGMAKGSGMIHPNMATLLGVITSDAVVTSDVWRKMVSVAVSRSFNQITVMQGLAKSIAWDGEGATCLIEVTVSGAASESEAAKIARSVASSSLAAVYGRDPNWGRIACAAGYAGASFHPNELRISLGDILLMEKGQPLLFDRVAASAYLRKAGETHGTVEIQISVGNGQGRSQAWGCDLSYDYVKINAEYTT